MSNHMWITPEEIARKKQFKRKLLYLSLPFIAVVISAIVTILVNQI
ncbi:hypothetical protein [Cytobacillus sp. NCCP-133]|nr:hypothetical protein [Cytobacillus sp. NCCP-133]GLB60276.1 hypothetical protein NCCP133_24080 [Cytobacillus sp. NCCP-133]